MAPMTPPARKAITNAGQKPRPACQASPKPTAATVMVEAIDRSMPPVVITKVCATPRMTRIAAASSIALMLPRVKKVGLRIENTTISATSPTGAAFSAQKLIWRASPSDVLQR